MEAEPSIFIGLLLRVGLPFGLTLLAAWLLRRWDEDWRSRGGMDANRQLVGQTIRCWVINDCPKEKRHACPAYLEQERPCWQVFRDREGRLPERCLDCDVFRRAPIPALAGRVQ